MLAVLAAAGDHASTIAGVKWTEIGRYGAAFAGSAAVAAITSAWLNNRHDRQRRSGGRVLVACRTYLTGVDAAVADLRALVEEHNSVVASWIEFQVIHEEIEDLPGFLNEDNKRHFERIREISMAIERSIRDCGLPIVELQLLLPAKAVGPKRGANCLRELDKMKDRLQRATPLFLSPDISPVDRMNFSEDEYNHRWASGHQRLEDDEAASMIKEVERLRDQFVEGVRDEVRS